MLLLVCGVRRNVPNASAACDLFGPKSTWQPRHAGLTADRGEAACGGVAAVDAVELIAEFAVLVARVDMVSWQLEGVCVPLGGFAGLVEVGLSGGASVRLPLRPGPGVVGAAATDDAVVSSGALGWRLAVPVLGLRALLEDGGEEVRVSVQRQ